MNNIYFCGEITAQAVQEFILKFNNLDPTQHIVIYLNSIGGEITQGKLLKDVINANGHNITLVAVSEICSSAFDLFFSCHTANKRILQDTVGMIHQGTYTLETYENGDLKSGFFSAIKYQGKQAHKRGLAFLKKLGLTEQELAGYKEGEDVFFTNVRLNQLLKNAQEN